MLGPPKVRDLTRPVVVSLESAVPQGHFYRHLERVLDLAFVRDLVADRYADVGRPSINPVVFFTLHLVMFFEGIRSERKLVEIASLNLAHRWYLGYNLDEPLPDHSSLSKIRTRLGLSVFRRFFEVIVEQCIAAGLVRGKELIFDATNLPRGHPERTRRWTPSNRPCISLWTITSPHSQELRPRDATESRAGSCSRNAASILTERRPPAAGGRVISGAARPIPMLP